MPTLVGLLRLSSGSPVFVTRRFLRGVSDLAPHSSRALLPQDEALDIKEKIADEKKRRKAIPRILDTHQKSEATIESPKLDTGR